MFNYPAPGKPQDFFEQNPSEWDTFHGASWSLDLFESQTKAALNFSSDVKVGSLKRKLGSVFSYFAARIACGSGLSERRLSDARNGQGSMPDLSRLPLRISKLFPVLWKNESSLSMISLKTSSITLKLKDVRFSCEPLFQYKKKNSKWRKRPFRFT